MNGLLVMVAICVHLAGHDGSPVKLIAHRGGVVDAKHIENNLPGIEEAVRREYWMLEIDIRESKDGRLIVHHDADFQRFYGDGGRVDDLTAADVKRLRSKPGNLPPLEFAEYAAACKGRIRLMLDTKGEHHGAAFFKSMLQSLADNDLLETALVIGSDQSRALFLDKAKIGVDRDKLAAAAARGEDVAKRYFLFASGKDIDGQTVELARRLGVLLVPSINTFHYPADQHMELAAGDIARLKKLGVTHFQIDSVYEKFCTAP